MSSKSREALKKIHHQLSLLFMKEIDIIVFGFRVKNIIKAALAEPLRNCDVGTDLEQAKRLRNICIKYRAMIGTCLNCPIFKPGDSPCDCFARWSQMPYESEVSHG